MAAEASRPAPTGLPVEDVVAELRAGLAGAGAAVLQAEPGAGKTTVAPLRLVDEPWMGGGRIVVLEPRRVAARAAAARMAELLGEDVGATVGYSTRDERRVGRDTRVEVVTDGILTRRLQRDPALTGTALVVFDEFHERHLQADLGLAVALDVREGLRPDLRVLVMSATLDAGPVATLLRGAPVVTSSGRTFPVTVRWRPIRPGGRLTAGVTGAIGHALARDTGDVLAFLPGISEIRAVADALGDVPGVEVLALHGSLPAAEQDRALRAGRGRRVVLATDLAETSVTVEGVGVVVDAGLSRRPAYDATSGLTRLRTVLASRASADQRAGRAGRTAAGVAYRLWSEAEHLARRAWPEPEIATVDLAGLALELSVWARRQAPCAGWTRRRPLPSPPPDSCSRSSGRSRTDGRRSSGAASPNCRCIRASRGCCLPQPARTGGRPRCWRRSCPSATSSGARRTTNPSPPTWRPAWPPSLVAAATACSRSTERRWRRSDAGPTSWPARVERAEAAARSSGSGAPAARAPAIPTGAPRPAGGEAGPGVLLADAYPDRIAQARGRGRYRLRQGGGAALPDHDPLATAAWLVAAEIDAPAGGAGRADGRIRLAAALERSDVERIGGNAIRTVVRLGWDEELDDLRATSERVLDDLVLDTVRGPASAGPETSAALVERAVRNGLALLHWTPAARSLQARAGWARRELGDTWPDLSDAALAACAGEWLTPLLAGARGRSDLARVDPSLPIRAALGGRRADLDRLAPPALELSGGRRVPIDYTGDRPRAAVKVQELFGTVTHPSVAGGHVPLTLELLSPAGRPIQVTADLPGFWAGSWREVRREMAGRYPKHPWPDDPASASPPAGRTGPRRQQ